MREDSKTDKVMEFFLDTHFLKIMAFMFAFMFLLMAVQWYAAVQRIDHLTGLQEVCEELGGVFIHEKACLKAENLFGDK